MDDAEKKKDNEGDEEFPRCYVCKRELIYGTYAIDIYGHKYCSMECVLKAEGEEADDE